MCGILGSFPFSNITVKYLKHRGPDGEGVTSIPEISSGHTRLSILDLTERGAQPMWSKDGDVLLVYNGEIYNYNSFEPAQKSCDTIFLSDWLVKKGTHFNPAELDGMYAFAAYFRKYQKLVLCRDPVGIKPLYIAISEDNSFLGFSSEIKGFFGIDWFEPNPNDNEEIQKDFLQYGYTYPQNIEIIFRNYKAELPLVPTLLKNVYQLCPGQKIIFSMDSAPVYSFTSLEKTDGEPIEFLSRSIKEQSMADVEVGVQLSGGIDSSLVAYEYALQNKNVHGFYVSVKDIGLCEDRWVNISVRELSKKTNFIFHKIDLNQSELKKVLPIVSWYMDEPVMRHPNAMGIYLLCNYVRKKTNVEVLLTGEGADEIFGGYSWHDGKTIEDFDKSRRMFNFGGSIMAKKYLNKYPSLPILQRQLLYDRDIYLPPILARQDRMSMAHSIESRVPFLSNRFLGISSVALPGKAALKKRAEAIFGKEFACRPKGGFGFPWAWLGDFKPPLGSLDWLKHRPQPKNEIERWVLASLGFWAENYLYGGWHKNWVLLYQQTEPVHSLFLNSLKEKIRLLKSKDELI